MDLRDNRGFSLVEVLIGVAVALIIGYFCLRLAGSVLHAMNITAQRFAGSSTLSALESHWLNEEDDAWAIFTPPNDVNGNGNSDGHEVDFFNRDIKHQTQFWAYTYDANAKTLTRSVYSALGGTPTTDEVFAGVTSFYAQTYPLTALQDPTSKIYSPLYQTATLQSGAVQFFSSAAPWIEGGNQITYVRLATANGVREMHLSTWTAPSGWTVVLNYTPRPTATPASALTVWPAAVRYPVSGTTLASMNAVPTLAQRINALFGGGVAYAAGCATARAYTDSTFSTPIANAPDPYDPSITTDGTGCMSKAAVTLHEVGYSGLFHDWNGQSSPCTTANVIYGTWMGTTQAITGGSTATMGCNLGFQDSNPTPQAAAMPAQVIQPCWAVDGSCSFTMSYVAGPGADCDASTGATSSGYDGTGHATISPTSAGTWSTTDAGADYTFTRTVAGAVTVNEYSKYTTAHATKQKSGGYSCSYSFTYSLAGTFTIPSV